MEKNQNNRIVVFDIDHTIIQDNLTKLLIKDHIKKHPWLFIRCIPLFLYDFFLKKIKLPFKIYYHLKRQNGTLNLKKLDTLLQASILKLYQKIFSVLNWMYPQEHDLENAATALFTPRQLQKLVYKKAITELKAQLAIPNTTVVLASGELETILQPFLKTLALLLDHNPATNRLLVVGTQNKNNHITTLSTSSGKVDRINELLDEYRLSNDSIVNAYSDNQFLTDLPLLLLANQKRIIISEKNRFYELLPKGIVDSFVFTPEWKK